MKKRRTLIISLLLVAALCLGVGYAAISVSDIIHGTVEMAANENFTVDFISVEVNDDGTAKPIAEGSPVTGDWGKIAFASGKSTVNMDLKTCDGFNAAGDTITLEFTIKNTSTESKYAAELVKTGITLSDYTITKADNSAVDEADGHYVEVTATLKDSTGTTTVWEDKTHAAPTTPATDFELAPEATATIVVVVEILRTPAEAIDITSLEITVPFNAKS